MVSLFHAYSRFCGRSRVSTCQQLSSANNALTRNDIGFRIVGRRTGGRGRAISDGAATIAPATTAATAAAPTQEDGEHDRFAEVWPEVSLPEMREVLLAELLDVPALQIRVRLTAALSVPVLWPRQQVVPLDLQSYQEDPSGTEGYAEQALLVHSREERCTIYQ